MAENFALRYIPGRLAWLPILLLASSTGLSAAQERPPNANRPPHAHPGQPRPPEQRKLDLRGLDAQHDGPPVCSAPCRQMCRGPLDCLFRPEPQDNDPLADGEEKELLAFAQEHMPRFYRAMENLRRKKPDRFESRLREHVPRLRQLRRIFESSPRIGEIILQHAENEYKVRRVTRVVHDERPDSPLHQRAMHELRQRVSTGVRLEIQVLEVMVAEREAQREQRIADRVTYWLADDADLATLPQEARELVQAYRDATDDETRQQAREQIERAATRWEGAETGALRKRINDWRSATEAEVDSRIQRLLKPPGPPAPEPRGRHREGGRPRP